MNKFEHGSADITICVTHPDAEQPYFKIICNEGKYVWSFLLDATATLDQLYNAIPSRAKWDTIKANLDKEPQNDTAI